MGTFMSFLRLTLSCLSIAALSVSFGAESAFPVGSRGIHTLRYYDPQNVLRHTSTSEYSIAIDANAFGVRMVRPDEAQEVRLTASSNYKEVYESLLSISVDPTTGAPVASVLSRK